MVERAKSIFSKSRENILLSHIVPNFVVNSTNAYFVV